MVASGVLGQQLSGGTQRALTHYACVHLTAPGCRVAHGTRLVKGNRTISGTVATSHPSGVPFLPNELGPSGSDCTGEAFC